MWACKHYAPEQIVTDKHWRNFDEINYEDRRKKPRRKTIICTNLKKETSTKFGVTLWCVGQCWGKCHICRIWNKEIKSKTSAKIYVKTLNLLNIIEKWLVRFVQIWNRPLSAPHFPSTTKHLVKIRLHMSFIFKINYTSYRLNYTK